MKHLGICCAVLLLSSHLALSQTELWRTQGTYDQIVPGKNGSVFLWTQDTLTKVDANGTVAWKRPGYYFSYPSGSGLYIFQYTRDSITCFTENGDVRWGQAEFDGDMTLATIDPSGNLYAISMSEPLSLLKFDSTGRMKFNVPFPGMPVPGIGEVTDSEIIAEPFIGANGNIGFIASVSLATEAYGSNGSSTLEEDGYLYLLVVSPATGRPVTPSTASKPWKQIDDEQWSYAKDDGKGNTTSIVLDNYPFLDPYWTLNGKFILAGTYTMHKEVNTATKSTVEDAGEWRVMVVNISGIVKTLAYSGAGIDRCSDVGYAEITDDQLNDLSDVMPGNGDILYAEGYEAHGQSTCGDPGLDQYQTLLKYDASAGTVKWNKSDLDQPIGVIGVLPSGHVLIIESSTSLIGYDDRGNPATGSLTFPDVIEGGYVMDGYSMYLKISNSGRDYVAKYLLSPLQLSVENPGVPYRFTLHQNYPNPFNPVTTIRFEIPIRARVTVKIYSMLGQEILTALTDEDLGAGSHETKFNASHLASGVYAYRLEAVGYDAARTVYREVKRMVLLK